VATQEADPFDERQTWWWRILTPLVCAFVAGMWAVLALGWLQERAHHDLYALLAYTDSAGTGQIFWHPGGEHYAHVLIGLPTLCGLGAMLISLVFGSVGLRRMGWATLFSYWLFGLICIAGFAAVMGWLWINAIGFFI
jgi:hypothetical protein